MKHAESLLDLLGLICQHRVYGKLKLLRRPTYKRRERLECIERVGVPLTRRACFSVQEELFIKFAEFEERCKEFERARAIFRYALDHIPKAQADAVYQRFVQFEKQHGDREGIEVRRLGGAHADYSYTCLHVSAQPQLAQPVVAYHASAQGAAVCEGPPQLRHTQVSLHIE